MSLKKFSKQEIQDAQNQVFVDSLAAGPVLDLVFEGFGFDTEYVKHSWKKTNSLLNAPNISRNMRLYAFQFKFNGFILPVLQFSC